MTDKQEGMRIGMQLVSNGYDGDYTVVDLVPLAKRLRTYYTNSCNGYNMDKYDRLAEKLEKKITDIAQGIGLHVYFQTDPRGGTLYVSTKSLNQYNYMRDGVYLE